MPHIRYSKREAGRQGGFTLLEMIVVLLLVGMISAVLMQGFIYVAGIFGSVERRQQFWSQQMLQRAWLKESIRSLTNGVDGELAREQFFYGEEREFGGLAVQGLSYAGGVGRPVRALWRFEYDQDGALELRYREIKLGEGSAEDNPWYTVARWAQGRGYFRYFSRGEWQETFSGRPLPGQSNPALPELILVTVDAGAHSLEVYVETGSSTLAYEPPGDGSGVL